jgi:hypothetical protein
MRIFFFGEIEREVAAKNYSEALASTLFNVIFEIQQ